MLFFSAISLIINYSFIVNGTETYIIIVTAENQLKATFFSSWFFLIIAGLFLVNLRYIEGLKGKELNDLETTG